MHISSIDGFVLQPKCLACCFIQAKPHLSQESLDLFTKLASPEDVREP